MSAMKVIVFVTLLFGHVAGSDFCNEKLRMEVGDAEELKNGTLLVRDGDLYPTGAFWEDEAGLWWTCPCLLGPCIRICDAEFAEETIKDYQLEPILWSGIFGKDVSLKESFKQVNNAKCNGVIAKRDPKDSKILSNGQLHIDGDSFDAEHYCVHQKAESSVYIVICFQAIEKMIYELVSLLAEADIFHRFPLISIISSIFLAFTALAYLLSSDAKSVYAKGVVCYSTCFALNLIAFAIAFFFVHGKIRISTLCVLFAYARLYFDLASVFWINSMSIDVYLNFKGIIASRCSGSYFTKLASFSFGTPMAIVAAALLFDTEVKPYTCWLKGRLSESLFYYAPTLIVLLASFGLLVLAVCSKQELVHDADETDATNLQQDEHRRRVCLALVSISGFTWIASLLASGSHGFWYILGFVNASRGVFIFCLLVCADKNVRQDFFSRLGFKRKATTVPLQLVVEDQLQTSLERH